MSEIAALQKHVCPACGAEANWNPGRQALVCPYCGNVSPAELASDGTTIKEHDLAIALRNIPQEKRGWDAERVSVQCQSCKAISLFDPKRVAQRCDFCGSPSIVPYTATRSPIHPESVLPFKVSESQVREQVRGWYRSRWFAPNKLKTAALTDTVHGLYVPYWTFDAQVAAQWTAEAGYYYYETVRRGGKTERVQKIRWEPAAGSLDHFFDDELVPATKGVDMKLLNKVGSFPTDSLAPYDTGYVSGGRAVSDRSGGRRGACAPGDGRQGPLDVLAAGAGRHAAQSAGRRRLLGADLQAHSRADLAARLQLRQADVSGDHQWSDRPDRWPVSV
jgi:predicted RNA-binding Zn-ribbon protein involved in translation (DUF1610 family)